MNVRMLRCATFALMTLAALSGALELHAQTSATKSEKTETKGKEPAPEISALPAKVDVEPIAADNQISSRLERILIATGWFENPHVEVREGVVFLTGVAQTEDHKVWAGNLVRNTQDTVALVNNLEIRQASAWDFQPIVASVRDMWRGFLQDFPYLVAAIMVLVATFYAAVRSRGMAERLLTEHIKVPLLRDIVSRIVSVVVFVIGLYLVMRISGITQLALTLLGGTGLFGLAIGIAFRDITENFLASIFLSMQRPFQIGDLVEIVGVQGYVDRLTVRTTVIMSLDGNSVQIPNATVYKSTIRNFTNNPNRRDEFTISIPVDKSIPDAQEKALKILREHPAVLQQPEPWVLVGNVGTQVDLKLYYWVDSIKNNMLTVRSSLTRLVFHALKEAKILNMPGPTKIEFPAGIPISISEDARESRDHGESDGGGDARRNGRPREKKKLQPIATAAEGSLDNNAEDLEHQARNARPVEAGPNLLAKTEEHEVAAK